MTDKQFPKNLTNEDLTTRTINGSGVVDAILEMAMNHFDDQVYKRAWDKTDSANTFASVMEVAIAQGVQYLLQRDTASLNNTLITKQIGLADRDIVLRDLAIEAQKKQNIILDSNIVVAQEEEIHARQTTELNGLNIQESAQRLRLNEINIEIQQKELVLREREILLKDAQLTLAKLDIELRQQELEIRLADLEMRREELAMRRDMHKLNIEIARADLELRQREMELKIKQYEVQYRISEMELKFKQEELEFKRQELAAQLEIAEMNKELIAQKVITEHAQTADKDKTGKQYTGVIGAQVRLYDQQIDSFVQDAKYKIGKLYNDSFVARKSVDEGTELPTSLDKIAFNAVFENMTRSAGINI